MPSRILDDYSYNNLSLLNFVNHKFYKYNLEFLNQALIRTFNFNKTNFIEIVRNSFFDTKAKLTSRSIKNKEVFIKNSKTLNTSIKVDP